MWRCPHCATPQAETARCWVCHRSSTSCASCRNFRNSVSAGVGYCSRDRGRAALSGQEIRSCWQPVLVLLDARGDAPAELGEGAPEAAALVPVGSLPGAGDAGRFWRDADN